MGLTRYSSTGTITDNFTYNYTQNKNRLTSISGTSAIQYKYDGNGNVLKDSGKNIALIIYDTDNLPVTVYKNDGSQIQYYYDVNGNRVKKTTVGGSSTYYINGYDGKTEVVSNVPTGSDFTYNIWGNDLIGQVRVVGTTATRYYYLKDHLGNIRMTVNSAGNPVSWDDYYPFGSVMPGRSQISSADNRYKFTSKERDTETNYDYFGARYYDARIARWLNIDPLFEIYPDQSPYNYCGNSPVNNIDPDGMEWIYINGEKIWQLDQTAVVVGQKYTYELIYGTPLDAYNDFVDNTIDVIEDLTDEEIPGWVKWIIQAGATPAKVPIFGPKVNAFRSVGAAAFKRPYVLQTGGNTLKASTAKALGVSKQQLNDAIHALKKDMRLRHDLHGKIMSNGDLLHPQTGEFLGNLFDYIN